MLIKITRGLGGAKGVHVLILTIEIGLVVLVGAFWLRYRMLKPKSVGVVSVSPEEVVVLGENARGVLPQVAYVVGDLARVAAFAVGRNAGGGWQRMRENSLVRVLEVSVADGETWVTVRREGGPAAALLVVHGSFLERYRPVVLDKKVELSDVKLIRTRSGNESQTGVSGWLRNVSGQPLTQCLVSCVFQDAEENQVDIRWSVELELPVGVLVPFQARQTEKAFESISLQIMYAGPTGLRNYLSQVVIPKSSLQ